MHAHTRNPKDRANTLKLAFLITHPIQYQSPLFSRIANEPDIDLVVFYQSECSVRDYHDDGFESSIRWDTPLLEGYSYKFLSALGRKDILGYVRPFNFGLGRTLKNDQFDALIIHGYNRPYHWATMLQAKKLGIRILIRDEATSFSRKRGWIKRFLKRIFFVLLDWTVDGYLTIGTANSNYYLSNGILKSRMHLTPYAVDNDFFRLNSIEASKKKHELRDSLDLEPDRPIVLFVGKLQKCKGIFDLFHAFQNAFNSLAPSPYLLFVGDGELKEKLIKLINSTGNDSIKFLGFQNQSKLPSFYDLCDVFVLPSHSETWGLVINEAMNAGKPIVVSDHVGCNFDLVKTNENGYVYTVGDIEELSKCLKKLLSDTLLTKKMGKKSEEIISEWNYQQDIKGIRKALGLKPSRVDY